MGLGNVTAVMSSPASKRVVDVRRVPRLPVKVNAIGITALGEPSGFTVSIWASNTRMATAMSLGCVAIQASLVPTKYGQLAGDAANGGTTAARLPACCRAWFVS